MQLIEQYKIDNINKIFPKDYHKICCDCKQIKLNTEFYKVNSFKSGSDSYCKQCKYEVVTNDIDLVLRKRLSTWSYLYFKNINKSEHTMNLLCCDSYFFKYWLELQFQFDTNIHWENYSSYWHLDQVKPCASFNFANIKGQQLCRHWSNFQ